MADQTLAANKLMEEVITAGEKDIINNYIDIMQINGTDITGGSVVGVVGETENIGAIDLLAGGEKPFGIVLGYTDESDKKASYSLGVTIADNAKVNVLRPTGERVAVQVILNRSATASNVLYIGDEIYASVTNAGQASGVKPTTANIEYKRRLGRLKGPSMAVSVTGNRVIEIWY